MKGKKVLIVEDSHLLALTLEDMLTDAGADVVAIAPSVEMGLRAMAVSYTHLTLPTNREV